VHEVADFAKIVAERAPSPIAGECVIAKQ